MAAPQTRLETNNTHNLLGRALEVPGLLVNFDKKEI